MSSSDAVFPMRAFSREDEQDDARFYATARLVNHLDSAALATVSELIDRLVISSAPAILDLMASWDTFSSQGIPGSYRFMFDPDSGGCYSVPVLTPTALRASIEPAEDPNVQSDPAVID